MILIKKSKMFILIFVIIFITSLLLAYEISWWTIDGGGNTSTSGTYTLSGTTGQPDAGILTGGTYTLTGGFWSFAPSTTFADIWYLY